MKQGPSNNDKKSGSANPFLEASFIMTSQSPPKDAILIYILYLYVPIFIYTSGPAVWAQKNFRTLPGEVLGPCEPLGP